MSDCNEHGDEPIICPGCRKPMVPVGVDVPIDEAKRYCWGRCKDGQMGSGWHLVRQEDLCAAMVDFMFQRDAANAENSALRARLAALESANERLREALAHALGCDGGHIEPCPTCYEAQDLLLDPGAAQGRVAGEGG